MPGPGEAEFDQLVGPAENEFDALVGPGSDREQILSAATNPAFRIGHGQEMPVTKIEGDRDYVADAASRDLPPSYIEAAGRGINAPLERSDQGHAYAKTIGQGIDAPVDPGIDLSDAPQFTQHFQNISTIPGVAKNFAATTAMNLAGAPVGALGQAGLGALQAGTARAADDPSATPEDIATSSGFGAGIGLGAGLAGKLGSKLVSAGNRGLARLALSPAESARLRAIGGEPKLADLGQRMRDAGLDKGRDLLQKFTPTDAKRIADNAQEITATQGPKIKQLEDELMQSNGFGQTELDTKPLTDELRGFTRPNSAETSTPRIARAMEKQAQRFEPVAQDVTVQGEEPALPPPLMKGPTGASPPLPSELAAPPPAPPTPPAQMELPLPPAAPVEAPPAVPPVPAPELPAPPSPQLNFGLRTPTEAPAQVTEPYTVGRAALDKRDIAQQLFDTKQRALQPNFGEDKAREMSWRFLKDRLQQEIDKGAASGALNPDKVADYRKASADFHTAADVQVDTAKRAETELRRSDRLFYGGAQAAGNAVPGTQYNLGRLLEKAKSLPPAAVAGLPSTGQPGAERAQSRGLDAPQMSFEERKQAEKQANDQMKSKMFGPWYNKLVGK